MHNHRPFSNALSQVGPFFAAFGRTCRQVDYKMAYGFVEVMDDNKAYLVRFALITDTSMGFTANSFHRPVILILVIDMD